MTLRARNKLAGCMSTITSSGKIDVEIALLASILECTVAANHTLFEVHVCLSLTLISINQCRVYGMITSQCD